MASCETLHGDIVREPGLQPSHDPDNEAGEFHHRRHLCALTGVVSGEAVERFDQHGE